MGEPDEPRNSKQRSGWKRSAAARRWRRIWVEALEPRQLLAGDITTGLVHHWTFDETSGDTAHDSVAGGTDATLLNWTAAEPKWTSGRIGGALVFSTADDAVVASPPAISGSYAVSFWLNVTDRNGPNARVFQSRAGNDIFINHESNRGISFSANNTNTFGPNPPTFNTWEHYAINFNASTGLGVIFRSGAPEAIGAIFNGAALTTWVIGHHTDLANHNDSLNGLLDDLRVYNRVLADEDIAILAGQGTPEATHDQPVHHWTFDETSGFTAHDSAGDADGTLVNWGPAEPRWENGRVGGALRFGTDDNAVVTPAVSTHAQWSVAFWLNVAAKTGVNPRVVDPWALLNLENNRGVGFIFHSTDNFDAKPVLLNTWEHYAITFDTVLDIAKIYRNGILVKTGQYEDNSPALQLIFGHNRDLANHNDSFNGLLDDLRIYDRPLSPGEVKELAGAIEVLGVTNANLLLRFDAYDPGTIQSATSITGLMSGESILGIDFRPATGELFGLGSTNRLYTIDPTSGKAKVRGGPFSFALLPGRAYGFDVNPVTDEIRVISNWEENIRLSPEDGAVLGVDSLLNYVSGDPNFGKSENPVATAYTNNFAGSTTTTLYDLNAFQDVLARQGGVNVPPGSPAPDSGDLVTIGSLGIDPTNDQTFDNAAFDILTLPNGTNIALAALTTNGQQSGLYSINLATGAASLLGMIGSAPTLLRGMSVVPAGVKFFDDGSFALRAETPGLREPAVPIFANGTLIDNRNHQLIEVYNGVPGTSSFPLTLVDIPANTYFRPAYQNVAGSEISLGTSVVGTASFRTAAGDDLHFLPTVTRADITTNDVSQYKSVVQGKFDDLASVISTRTLATDPKVGQTEVLLNVRFQATGNIALATGSDFVNNDRVRLVTVSSMFSSQTQFDANVLRYEDKAGVIHELRFKDNTPRDARLFPAAVEIGSWFELIKEPGSTWFGNSSSIRVDLGNKHDQKLAIQGFLFGSTDPNEDSLTVWIERLDTPDTIPAGSIYELDLKVTATPPRNVANSPWYNAANPLDVSNDARVEPLDALLVINYLNAQFPTTIAINAASGGGPGFLETSNNYAVEPLDALLVINALNAGLGGEGEAGSESEPAADFSTLLGILAGDSAEQALKRRRGL